MSYCSRVIKGLLRKVPVREKDGFKQLKKLTMRLASLRAATLVV